MTTALKLSDRITSFQGEYAFLSNMASQHGGLPELRLRMGGLVFGSAEAAYQAAKSLDPDVRRRLAAEPSPYAAKRLGKAVSRGGIVVLRDDWSQIRLEVMRGVVRQKFAHRPYAALLLQTGDAELVEGNTWGDVFWGECRGRGSNWLGKILMETRLALQVHQTS